MTRNPPETVAEAIELLRSWGYRDDFELSPEGLRTDAESGLHDLAGARVDHTFRFEGMSDPDDEAIVLGVSCPDWGRRGIVVSAYGPSIDPEHAELLAALSATPERDT
ncbi:MAG: hypothetical protein WHS89_10240 [Acidimicrobiales bacterium]|jgi:hypothetical protein